MKCEKAQAKAELAKSWAMGLLGVSQTDNTKTEQPKSPMNEHSTNKQEGSKNMYYLPKQANTHTKCK